MKLNFTVKLPTEDIQSMENNQLIPEFKYELLNDDQPSIANHTKMSEQIQKKLKNNPQSIYDEQMNKLSTISRQLHNELEVTNLWVHCLKPEHLVTTEEEKFRFEKICSKLENAYEEHRNNITQLHLETIQNPDFLSTEELMSKLQKWKENYKQLETKIKLEDNKADYYRVVEDQNERLLKQQSMLEPSIIAMRAKLEATLHLLREVPDDKMNQMLIVYDKNIPLSNNPDMLIQAKYEQASEEIKKFQLKIRKLEKQIFEKNVENEKLKERVTNNINYEALIQSLNAKNRVLDEKLTNNVEIINRSNNKIKKLKEKNEEFFAALETNAQIKSSLQIHIQKIEKALQNANEKNQALLEKIENMELDQADGKTANFNETRTDYELNEETYVGQIDELREKEYQLTQEISVFELDRQKSKDEFIMLKEERNILKTDLNNAIQNRALLENDLETKDAEIKGIKHENEKLKNQLDKINSSLIDFNFENNELKQQKRKLGEQNSVLQNQNDNLRERLEKATSSNLNNEQIIQKLKNELNDAQKTNNVITKELELEKGKVNPLKDKIRRIENNVSELRNKSRNPSVNKGKSEDRKPARSTTSNAQLEAFKNEIKMLKNEITKLKQNKSGFDEILKKEIEKCKIAEAQIPKLKQKITEGEFLMKEKDTKNEKLKETIKNCENDLNKINEKLDQKTKETIALNKVISTNLKEQDKLTKLQNELISEKINLKNSLLFSNQKLDSLESQFENEIKEMKHKIDSLEEQLRHKNTSLKKKENEIDELQNELEMFKNENKNDKNSGEILLFKNKEIVVEKSPPENDKPNEWRQSNENDDLIVLESENIILKNKIKTLEDEINKKQQQMMDFMQTKPTEKTMNFENDNLKNENTFLRQRILNLETKIYQKQTHVFSKMTIQKETNVNTNTSVEVHSETTSEFQNELKLISLTNDFNNLKSINQDLEKINLNLTNKLHSFESQPFVLKTDDMKRKLEEYDFIVSELQIEKQTNQELKNFNKMLNDELLDLSKLILLDKKVDIGESVSLDDHLSKVNGLKTITDNQSQQLETFKNQIAMLENELNEMINKNEDIRLENQRTLEMEKDRFRQNEADLQTIIEKKRQKVANLKSEIKKHKVETNETEHEMIENELDEHKSTQKQSKNSKESDTKINHLLQKMKKELSDQRKHIDLNEEVKLEIKKLGDLFSKNIELSKQKDQLMTKLKTLKSELENKDKKIKELINKNQLANENEMKERNINKNLMMEKSEESKSFKTKTTELSNQIEKLKNELVETQKVADKKSNKLENENHEKNEIIKELKKQKEQNEFEIQKLMKEIENLKKINQDFENQTNVLNKKIIENNSNATVLSEISEMKSIIQKLKQENIEKQNEIQKLNDDSGKSQLLSENQKFKDYIDELKTKCEEFCRESDKFEHEIDENKALLNATIFNSKKFETELKSLKNKEKYLENSNNSLKANLEKLQTQNEELKKTFLEQKTKDKKTHEIELEQKTTENENLKTKIDDLSIELEALKNFVKQENQVKKTKIERKVEAKIQSKEKTTPTLTQNDFDNLKKLNNSLENERTEMTNEIIDLKTKFQDILNELKSKEIELEISKTKMNQKDDECEILKKNALEFEQIYQKNKLKTKELKLKVQNSQMTNEESSNSIVEKLKKELTFSDKNNQKLESNVKTLKNDLEALKTKYLNESKKNQTREDLLKSFETDNANQKSEIDRSKNRNKKLENELDKSDKLVQSQIEEICDYKKDNAKITNENEKIKKLLEKMTNDANGFKTEMEKTKEDNKNFSKKLDSKNDDLKNLNAKIKNESEKIEELKKETNSKQIEIEKIHEKCDALKAQKIELENIARENRKIIEEIKEKCQNLALKTTQQENDNNNLRKKINDLISENSILENEVENVKFELKKCTNNIAKMTLFNTELAMENTKINDELRNFKIEINEIKTKQKFDEKTPKVRASIIDFSYEINSNNSNLNQNDEQISDLLVKIEKLEFDKRQDEITLNELGAEQQKLNLKIALISSSNDSLMQENDKLKLSKKELEKIEDNLTRQVENLKLKNEKASGKIEALKAEQQNTREIIIDLEKQLNELNKNNDILREKLNEQQSENLILSHQINLLNKKNNENENKKKQLEDQLLNQKVNADKHENDAKDSKAIIEVLKKNNDDLKTLLNESNKQLINGMQNCVTKDAEISKLANELMTHKNSKFETESKTKFLTEMNEVLSKSVDEQKNENKRILNEINVLKKSDHNQSKMNHTSSSSVNNSKSISRHITTTQGIETKKVTITQNSLNPNNEMLELNLSKKQIEFYQKKIVALEKESQSSRNNHSELELKIDELNEQIEDLSKKLNESNKWIDFYKNNQKSKSETKINQIENRDDLDTMRELVIKKTSDLFKLEAENASLIDDLKNQSELNLMLNTKINELSTKIQGVLDKSKQDEIVIQKLSEHNSILQQNAEKEIKISQFCKNEMLVLQNLINNLKITTEIPSKNHEKLLIISLKKDILLMQNEAAYKNKLTTDFNEQIQTLLGEKTKLKSVLIEQVTRNEELSHELTDSKKTIDFLSFQNESLKDYVNNLTEKLKNGYIGSGFAQNQESNYPNINEVENVSKNTLTFKQTNNNKNEPKLETNQFDKEVKMNELLRQNANLENDSKMNELFQQNANLENQLENELQNNRNLNLQIQNLKDELKDKNTKINHNEEKIKRVVDKCQQLQNFNSDLQIEVEKLKANIKNVEDKLRKNQASSSNKHYEIKLTEIEKKNSKLELENLDQKGKMSELRNQLKTLKKEFDDSKELINEKDEKLNYKEMENEMLKNQLNEILDSLKLQKTENNELKEQLQKTLKVSEKSKEAARNWETEAINRGFEVTLKNEFIEKLKRTTRNFEKQQMSWEKSLTVLKENSTKENSVEISENLKAQIMKLGTISTENIVMRNQLEAKNYLIIQHQNDAKEEKDKVDGLKRELEKINDLLKNKEHEIEAQDDKTRNFENQLKICEAKVIALENLLDSKIQYIADLKNQHEIQLNSMNTNINKFTTIEVAKELREIQTTAEGPNENDEFANELIKNLEELKTRLTEKEKQLQNAQLTLETSCNQNANKESIIEALKTKLGQNNSGIENLEDTNESLKNANRHLKNELQMKQHQLNTYHKLLEELKTLRVVENQKLSKISINSNQIRNVTLQNDVLKNEKLTNFVSENDQLLNENEQLNEQIIQLNRKIKKLNEHKENSITTNNELNTTISELVSKLKESEQKHLTLEANLFEIHRNFTNLTAEHKFLNEENQTNIKKNQMLMENTSQYSSKKNEFITENDRLSLKIKELNLEIHKLKNEMKEKDNLYNSKMDEWKKINEDLKNIELENAQLLLDNKNLKNEIKEKNKQNNDLINQINDEIDAKNQLEKQHNELNNLANEKTDLLQKLSEDLKQSKNETKEKETSLNQAKVENKKLKEKLKELEKSQNELLLKFEIKNEEINDLIAKNTKLETEAKELTIEVKNIKTNYSSEISQKSTFSNEIEKLKRDKKNLRNEIDEKNNSIFELENEKDKLGKDLYKSQKSKSDLQDDFEKLKDENQRILNKQNSQKNQLEKDLNEKIETLKAKLNQTQSEMKEKDSRILILNNNTSSFSEKDTFLNKKISQLNQEIIDLKSQLEILENSLEKQNNENLRELKNKENENEQINNEYNVLKLKFEDFEAKNQIDREKIMKLEKQLVLANVQKSKHENLEESENQKMTIDALKKEIKDYKNQVRKLNEQIDELSGLLKSKNNENELINLKLNKEINATKIKNEEIENLEQKLRNYEIELKDKTTTLTSFQLSEKNEKDKKTNENNELIRKLEKLESNLSSEKLQNKDLQNQILSNEAKIKELKSQVANLENKNKDQQFQLLNNENKINEIQANSDKIEKDLKSQISKLEIKIKEITTISNKSEKEKKELELKIIELTESLKKSKQEFDRFKSKKEEEQKEWALLNNQNTLRIETLNKKVLSDDSLDDWHDLALALSGVIKSSKQIIEEQTGEKVAETAEFSDKKDTSKGYSKLTNLQIEKIKKFLKEIKTNNGKLKEIKIEKEADKRQQMQAHKIKMEIFKKMMNKMQSVSTQFTEIMVLNNEQKFKSVRFDIESDDADDYSDGMHRQMDFLSENMMILKESFLKLKKLESDIKSGRIKAGCLDDFRDVHAQLEKSNQYLRDGIKLINRTKVSFNENKLIQSERPEEWLEQIKSDFYQNHESNKILLTDLKNLTNEFNDIQSKYLEETSKSKRFEVTRELQTVIDSFNGLMGGFSEFVSGNDFGNSSYSFTKITSTKFASSDEFYRLLNEVTSNFKENLKQIYAKVTDLKSENRRLKIVEAESKNMLKSEDVVESLIELQNKAKDVGKEIGLITSKLNLPAPQTTNEFRKNMEDPKFAFTLVFRTLEGYLKSCKEIQKEINERKLEIDRLKQIEKEIKTVNVSETRIDDFIKMMKSELKINHLARKISKDEVNRYVTEVNIDIKQTDEAISLFNSLNKESVKYLEDIQDKMTRLISENQNLKEQIESFSKTKTEKDKQKLNEVNFSRDTEKLDKI